MKLDRRLERDEVFDRIVLIACRLVRSPLALILSPSSRRTIVLGGFGFDEAEIPASLKMSDFSDLTDRLSYVDRLQHQPWFRRSPLLHVLPQARSAVVIRLRGEAGRAPALFFLFDPNARWPFNSRLTITLLDLVELASHRIEFLIGLQGKQLRPDGNGAKGFSERSDDDFDGHGPDPVSQFLLETLVSRQNIRSRNSISYVSVRSWRSPIRTYQIRAIGALKKAPPTQFVQAVADELCRAVTRVYGRPHFNHVVPVPCGHSRRADCLSVLLAREIGHKLNIAVTEPFVTRHRRGSSHPRKNAALPPLQATTEVKGNVLLVDDIATSGRHIEQVARHLSQTADHVYSIVWISG
jgi:hypothetical protein